MFRCLKSSLEKCHKKSVGIVLVWSDAKCRISKWKKNCWNEEKKVFFIIIILNFEEIKIILKITKSQKWEYSLNYWYNEKHRYDEIQTNTTWIDMDDFTENICRCCVNNKVENRNQTKLCLKPVLIEIRKVKRNTQTHTLTCTCPDMDHHTFSIWMRQPYTQPTHTNAINAHQNTESITKILELNEFANKTNS